MRIIQLLVVWVLVALPIQAQTTDATQQKIDSIKAEAAKAINRLRALDTHSKRAVDSMRQKQDTTERLDTIVIRLSQPMAYTRRQGAAIKPIDSSSVRGANIQEKIKRFHMPSFWTKTNRATINLNEVAFVNWNAGGNNSVSGIMSLHSERNYKFRYVQWNNSLDFRYGLNAQEGQTIRKTDDQIRLSSTFGHRKDTISKWYSSGKMNFNTQLSNGYKYPDRTTPISRLMAPGYLFLGVGTSYIDDAKKLNIYLSPLTQKATFVLDQDLADRGAFGVRKATYDALGNKITDGEKVFMELGILVTNTYERTVAENVLVKSNLSLYTDYLASFGNIDVDWFLDIHLKVNKFISSNIGMHFIYDDDILFDRVVNDLGFVEQNGRPKLQFKQLLGFGVVYAF
ncbi:MAG: DUF3078 domain-containing protein [Flavobacteriaceae bacterium]|jgi:hypothetical protein|nr:DUF3078 domain-containing protein [Flavobacteriaceae bacterium]MDP4674978.1 DUF3078 domain-containing protein [Flavobacteriaceae bacterium]MDP4755220.1 DUF3078 domain-containing protein [Flavobacteriaceae bacterium]MDP4795155.1 DUF3078 domain-containing protein [Flavobacteriaceae bacterium]MDP4971827.1 DUF3078 domain-containing protein [Flavobacteriaceae bacterium]